MTPLTHFELELRQFVGAAQDLSPGTEATHEHLQDFRTEVVGDLLDLLDQFYPGLGTRLMVAMYPRADVLRSSL